MNSPLFLRIVLIAVLSITSVGGVSTKAQAAPCALPLPAAQLCASIQWDSAPSASRPNAFTLRFWNLESGSEAGPYVSPLQEPFVKLWMPSMGHGSRPVSFSPARDAAGQIIPGVYRVEKVIFTMRGDWDIQIQLREQGQVREQVALSLYL